jgi:hypothetical protein
LSPFRFAPIAGEVHEFYHHEKTDKEDQGQDGKTIKKD